MSRKLKIPHFSRGTYEELKRHLKDKDGVFYDLDRTIYYYVTEGEYEGSLILVSLNKTVHFVHDSALASTVNEMSGAVTSHTSELQQLFDLVNGLQDNVARLDGANASQDEITGSLETQVTNAAASITSLTTELSALTRTINELQTRVSSISTSISNLDLSVGNLQGDMRTAKSNIAALREDVSELQAEVEQHETRFDGIDSSIARINNNMDALQQRVTTAQANITNLQTTTYRKSEIDNMLEGLIS